MSQEEFLTPKETAELLKVSVATLAMWRCNKRYALPYYKIGGSIIRYKLADLTLFINGSIAVKKDNHVHEFVKCPQLTGDKLFCLECGALGD